MQAPRRSHALSWSPAAKAGAPVSPCLPALAPSNAPGASPSPPSTHPRRNSTKAAAQRRDSSHLSPRALWRAPPPRPVVAPSLLPVLSSATTSSFRGRNAQTSREEARRALLPFASAPQQHEGDTRENQTKHGEAGYEGELYDRVIFTPPDEALTHAATLPDDEKTEQLSRTSAAAPTTPPPCHATSTQAPVSGTITAAEAAAAVARLPVLKVKEPMRAKDAGSASAAQAQTEKTFPPRRQTQPAPWWSTLDGTASSALASLPHPPYPPAFSSTTRTAPPPRPTGEESAEVNLNDTLGRADRANMVLSLSFPHSSLMGTVQSASAPPTHDTVDDEIEGWLRRGTASGSAEKGGGGDPGISDAVSAAVAALAARLSRAGGPWHLSRRYSPSHSRNDSHAFSDTAATMNTFAHHSTIQELRDALRLTESSGNVRQEGAEDEEQEGEAFLSEWGEAVEESRGRVAQTSSPTQPRAPQQRAFDGKDAVAEKRVGTKASTATATTANAAVPPQQPLVGTQRTRAALARLYALAPACTATATATTLAHPSATSATLPSSPRLSEATRWWEGGLTVAAVERRFGPLEAKHRPQHRAEMPRGQQRPPSLDASDFSAASMTSSIVANAHAGARKTPQGCLAHTEEREEDDTASVTPLRRRAFRSQQPPTTRTAALKALTMKTDAVGRVGKVSDVYASALSDAVRVEVTKWPPTAPFLLEASTEAPVSPSTALQSTANQKQKQCCLSSEVTNLNTCAVASLSSPRQLQEPRRPRLPVPPPPTTQNPLQEALDARQALLQRHVPVSVAWGRLLHAVRQWCDTTQVMIRFDSGVCVEQLAGGPSQRRLGQQQRQQEDVHFAMKENTAEAAASASVSSADCPHCSSDTSRKAATAWDHFTYVDDPMAAHDVAMQHLAHDTKGLRRHNSLRWCRQRQEAQRASLAGLDAQSPLDSPSKILRASSPALKRYSITVPLADPFTAGKAETTLTSPLSPMDAQARMSFCGSQLHNPETLARSVSPRDGGAEELGSHESSRWPHASGEERERVGRPLYTPYSFLPSTADGGPSTSPAQSRHGVAAQHAAVCASFQTWGAPLTDDEGQPPSTWVCATASDTHSADRDDSSGAMVLWKETVGAENQRTSRLQLGTRDSPVVLHSTVASKVELELLAFVLTLGGGTDDVNHGTSIAPSRIHRSLQDVPYGGADGGVDFAYQHPFVQTLRSTLHGGFGLSETGEAEAHCEVPKPPPPPASAAAEVPTTHLPWDAWLTSLLSNYDGVDLNLLKALHRLLWTYETQTSREGSGSRPDQDLARQAEDSISSSSPLAVWPLHLTLHTPPQSNDPIRGSNRDAATRAVAAAQHLSELDVTVDAAALYGALTSAASSSSSLRQWLLEARQQRPREDWSTVVAGLPPAQQQTWHAILFDAVKRKEAARDTSALRLGTGEVVSSQGGGQGSTKEQEEVCFFTCDVAGAVLASAWRVRRLYEVLQRVYAHCDTRMVLSRETETSGTHEAPSLSPFPCHGSTPYIPGEEGRTHYTKDVRSAYLFAVLAGEEVENQVVPQLASTQRHYAAAREAALEGLSGDTPASTDAVHTTSGPAEKNASSVYMTRKQRVLAAPSSTAADPSTVSLTQALQQRVPLYRLHQLEQRYVSLLSKLWRQEQTIHAFNQHVQPFNDFTRSEQRRWAPLYRSSLTVAFLVCKELAEKKMEGIDPDVVPFVSIVAAFTGCRGGHRELRDKLTNVMLDLTERATRVHLSLESLAFQGGHQQILREAVAAAQQAPRRAAAVVTGLATEADVLAEPTLEVVLPGARLREVPTLFPSR